MKTKYVKISTVVICLIFFSGWMNLVFTRLERDQEMAKLALMGEFKVDSVTPGKFFSGDCYTVARVEEFPGGELQRLALSQTTTRWLRENPHRDSFKSGIPVGTTPRPLPSHPHSVEFDVVVWKLEPVFTGDGDVSYRAKHYATRVVTTEHHPWALRQASSAGAN